jgi:hypothetical protein
MKDLPASMEAEDLAALKDATGHLEHPSLAVRLSSIIGTPIDIAIKLLPRPIYKRTRAVAEIAIEKAFKAALSSLRHDQYSNPNDHMYRMMAAGSGAAGGLFGIYSLPIELGISTTIMMRSIAEIARANGEDLHDPETQAACLEVFALGGESEDDDAADTGYYGIRMALAWPVTHAAHHLARNGLVAEGPMLTTLISAVSARFGIAVSQKMAAVMVPVLGAAGAATINTVFMAHFQEMAHAHFVVRRLERKYGKELVQANYENFVNA